MFEQNIAENTRQGNLRTVIENAQSVFGLVIALGTFLSASGYIIVQTNIGRYSAVNSVDIPPTIYIAAGSGLMLVVVVSALLVLAMGSLLKYIQSLILSRVPRERIPKGVIRFGKLLKNLRLISRTGTLDSFPWYGVSYVLVLLLPLFFSGSRLLNGVVTMLLLIMALMFWLKEFGDIMTNVSPDSLLSRVARQSPTLIGFIVYTVLAGFFYGVSIYPEVPFVFSGGRPTVISVVFQTPEQAERMGLTLEEEGYSEPVCLVAELVDGLLVYEPEGDRSLVLYANEQTLVSYFGRSDRNWREFCEPRTGDEEDEG